MDKRITRFASLEAMKAAEFLHWQSLPARERIQAVSDISNAAYAMKGSLSDVPRLQRPLVRLQRTSGVDFDAAWQRRVDAAIEDGLTVPFISREDLLAAKIAAGRPQDIADAAALQETQDIQDMPDKGNPP